MADSAGSGTPQWKSYSTSGPAVAHHASCVLRNKLFVHGGVERHGGAQPGSGLWCLDLDAATWSAVSAAGSPALSHHAAVGRDNRYLVLVGGWDGKRRTSGVHVFDVEETTWFRCRTEGFPEGAGLSSHTATLDANNDIVVIGREGSLRTQRRSGNAFRLRGDLRSWTYTSLPLGVDSRSGHSAHIVGGRLHVIGGRSDKLLETHGGFRGADSSPCTALQKLIEHTEQLKPMLKPPGGRKHHVSACGPGGGAAGAVILLHGGETFDGRSREPVGETFAARLTPPGGGGARWCRLAPSPIGLAGHSCAVTRDAVLVHGGVTGRGRTVSSHTYCLQL